MMWSFKKFSRLHFAVLALLIIVLIGVAGYSSIEKFTVIESFYMTIITISTVGFSEVQPLSTNGKIFTLLLIISSFGVFAYTVSAVSSYIFTGEFRRYFKQKKLEKTLGHLKDHVIICGYGRNGKRATEEFRAHKVNFIVIEEKENIVDQINDKEEILIIHGDSTEDEVLERAHIKTAKALISTLPVDADNLLTVLTARELNKDLLIISRASQDNSYSKLKMAGADNVIMPDKIGGAHMATLVLRPDIVEFFDQIIMQNPESPYLREVMCSDLSCDNMDHTLGELKNLSKSGVAIIGMKKDDGEYLINPSNSVKLSPGSKLFVLGTSEQISAL